MKSIRVLKPKPAQPPQPPAFAKSLEPREAQTGRWAGATLTPQDVVEIRRAHKAREATMRELAVKYGVSPTSIHAAIRGDTWKSVKEEQP